MGATCQRCRAIFLAERLFGDGFRNGLTWFEDGFGMIWGWFWHRFAWFCCDSAANYLQESKKKWFPARISLTPSWNNPKNSSGYGSNVGAVPSSFNLYPSFSQGLAGQPWPTMADGIEGWLLEWKLHYTRFGWPPLLCPEKPGMRLLLDSNWVKISLC